MNEEEASARVRDRPARACSPGRTDAELSRRVPAPILTLTLTLTQTLALTLTLTLTLTWSQEGDAVWLTTWSYLTPTALSLANVGGGVAAMRAAATPLRALPPQFDASTHEVSQGS